MKNIKFIIPVLLILIIVGFAAVNFTLSISGNAGLVGDLSEFEVYFSNVKVNGKQDLSLISSPTLLKFNGLLEEPGDMYTITYDVTNGSKYFDAIISIDCTQGNEFLSIQNRFDTSTNFSALETRSGTLVMKSLKSIVSYDNLSNSVSCSLSAVPVERDSAAEGGAPSKPGVMLKSYFKDVDEFFYEGDYPNPSTTADFRSDKYLSYITNVYIERGIDIPSDAIESWDISALQSGSVMAYVVESENPIPEDWESYDESDTYYDLYIQSDLELYANSNMIGWFSFMDRLMTINGLELLNTSAVTDMTGMFADVAYYSPEITLELNSFDTSNVTSMFYMFTSVGSNSAVVDLDLSSFDTSNVTNMSYMFASVAEDSEEFTLDISNFDTSKVTDMSFMFYYIGNSSHNFVLDLSNFDTRNVTNMSYMFEGVGSENSNFILDLSSFDTSSVTDMSSMFSEIGYDSENLTLIFGDKFDTSNVTNMESMFSGMGYNSRNISLDLSGFDTSKVTDMGDMFREMGYNSTSLSLNLSSFNTSNVTNMRSMFYHVGYNSTSLSLNLSSFNTSNVTHMDYMFSNTGYNATDFTLDISNFDTSNVTCMRSMFNSIGYNNPNFALNLGEFDTSSVTDFYAAFKGAGYKSTILNNTITIRNSNIDSSYFRSIFSDLAVNSGTQFVVNYTSETEALVDEMLLTKSEGSNVIKGNLVN